MPTIKKDSVQTKLTDSATGKSGNFEEVTTWYDGSPMDDSKCDNDIYWKLPSDVGGGYVRKILGTYGQVLQKNTMAELRALSSTELLLIKMGYFNHVQLNGYYAMGDTPDPINYILSSSLSPDDGGSIVEVGGIKLEHNFAKNPNVSYFGARGDGSDDWQYLQNALDYTRDKSLKIQLKEGTVYSISQTLNVWNFRGGIVSDSGNNHYIDSEIRLQPTSTSLIVVRVWNAGITLKNITIRGRSASLSNSILVQFKRVDEYPNTGDEYVDDLVNNVDCIIDGCNFLASETHLEFWGRQVTVTDCSFSGGQNGIRIFQFNQLGKYGGSARAYRIYDNMFHSFDSGNANRENYAIINNQTTDGYGFDIKCNFSDSFNTFFKGNLFNSLITSNNLYNLVGYAVSGGQIIQSNIVGNNFINAQRYSDQSSVPPYNTKGGVFATTITSTTISNNRFAPTLGNVISAEGVTHSIITTNSFYRWGTAYSVPMAAIKLDASTNTTSKSSSNTIESNTFFQSYVSASYIVETGTFSPTNYYGNSNRVRLTNGSTIISLFNTPNFKMSHGFTFRRDLAEGENIDDLANDINNISGQYNIVSTDIASSIIGAPAANFIGTIDSYVTNIGVTQIANRILSNGDETFTRRVSDGVVGGWIRIIQSTNVATTTENGIVKQALPSTDIASDVGSVYSQSEVQAILTEIRDLKIKLQSAGILAV